MIWSAPELGQIFTSHNELHHAVISMQRHYKTRACSKCDRVYWWHTISYFLPNKRTYYSGYSRHHDLLYIAIAFPDGTLTIGNASLQGNFNDVKALQYCGFDQEGLANLTTERYLIGGDCIFSSRTNQWIITPQSYESIVDKQAFLSCRVPVEWLFGLLKEFFPYLCSRKM